MTMLMQAATCCMHIPLLCIMANAVLHTSSLHGVAQLMQACPGQSSGKLGHHRYTQYARSKLCNVLHALELQRIFAAQGRGATACAVSPGRVNTQIFDNLPPLAQALVRPLAASFFQTPKQVYAS